MNRETEIHPLVALKGSSIERESLAQIGSVQKTTATAVHATGQQINKATLFPGQWRLQWIYTAIFSIALKNKEKQGTVISSSIRNRVRKINAWQIGKDKLDTEMPLRF